MTRRFDDRRGLGPRGDEKRLLPKRLRRDDQLRLQDQASQALGCFADIDATYRQMAERLQDFNVLSYLSSHDTRLFFAGDAKGSLPLQQRAANLLLLAPGAVQIYYGDESGRPLGPTGSDPLQGTRSDMNWRELLGEKPRCWPTGNGWGSSALATRRSAAACKPRSRTPPTTPSAAGSATIR